MTPISISSAIALVRGVPPSDAAAVSPHSAGFRNAGTLPLAGRAATGNTLDAKGLGAGTPARVAVPSKCESDDESLWAAVPVSSKTASAVSKGASEAPKFASAMSEEPTEGLPADSPASTAPALPRAPRRSHDKQALAMAIFRLQRDRGVLTTPDHSRDHSVRSSS